MISGLDRLDDLWTREPIRGPVSARVDAVLGAVVHLPLPYWRPGMLFRGARDSELIQLTGGRFPGKPRPKGTHPLFSLKPLPQGAGFKVCPCSSKRPFDPQESRFIEKGCRLLHKGYVTDRRSYLVETAHFNIPPSVAWEVRFLGEVPADCIKGTAPSGVVT